MRKSSLGLIVFDPGGDPGALCWVDAYEAPGEVPVVVCSQLPRDPQAYVTGASRYLAARLLLERWPERAGIPDALAWFEYYSYTGRESFRSAFMRVRFKSWAIERGSWGDHGARLGEIDVWEMVRRADVRELVGQEVGHRGRVRAPRGSGPAGVGTRPRADRHGMLYFELLSTAALSLARWSLSCLLRKDARSGATAFLAPHAWMSHTSSTRVPAPTGTSV